uniref:HTH myb-type domain-containing protein n=1 Tax=Periophthalmus magnuspinnatus TaxID=409849 RepID=A0A3B4BI57_9GOBI
MSRVNLILTVLQHGFVFCIYFSSDEDEELHSTDPESKEKNKDKKVLCKVKWSRDEGRTDGQCQHRWQKVLNPELVKGPWTKEEDQKVR